MKYMILANLIFSKLLLQKQYYCMDSTYIYKVHISFAVIFPHCRTQKRFFF